MISSIDEFIASIPTEDLTVYSQTEEKQHELIEYIVSQGRLTREQAHTLIIDDKPITIQDGTKTKTIYPSQYKSHNYYNHPKGARANNTQRHHHKTQVSFEDLLTDGNKESTDVDEACDLYSTAYFCLSLDMRKETVHYYDIDDLTQRLSVEQLTKFFKRIYHQISINIEYISIAECVKNKDGKTIHGYHISVPEICSSVDTLKHLVRHINEQQMNQELIDEQLRDIILDDNVYKPNQVFRMPYSTDSMKPTPYIIIHGSYRDWDLMNTTQSRNITKHLQELLQTISHSSQPMRQKHIQYTPAQTIEPLKEYLLCNHLSDPYNCDFMPFAMKVDLLIQFHDTIRDINNKKSSLYDQFLIHNYRTTYTTDNSCPQQYKHNLIMSKYLFCTQIYYTLIVALHNEYGDSAGSQANQKLLEKTVRDMCCLYDDCRTQKASRTGTLYETALRITPSSTHNDSRLMRIIDYFNHNLFSSFLSKLNSYNMNPTDNEQEHTFITSSYTIEDYLSNYINYKTLAQHVHAITQCIAKVSDKKNYIMKIFNYDTNRIYYRVVSQNIFNTDYDVDISYRSTCDAIVLDKIKTKEPLPDEMFIVSDDETDLSSNDNGSETIDIVDTCYYEPDEGHYYTSNQDDSFLSTSSFVSQASNTSTISNSTNSKQSKSSEKLKKVIKRLSFKTCKLLKMVHRLSEHKLLLNVNHIKPFAHINYTFVDTPTQQKQPHQSTATALLKSITDIELPALEQPIERKTYKQPTKFILPMFTPPVETTYNKRLITAWFKFMFTRIKSQYHNAFRDFIYSIRYRLTSDGPTPAKAYILHGQHGSEGKSFLLGCLSKVFGEFASTPDREKFLNDKFDKWQSQKGLICIEECESSIEKHNELAKAIKVHTTQNGMSRGMGEESKNIINYAIIALTSNDYTLNGLIHADEACISRLVIIDFEKAPFTDQEWSDISQRFTEDITFTYSLWRYIITDDFVENFGDGYSYSTERYFGQEKFDYINKAKNERNVLGDLFVKLLRYNKPEYNELSSMVKNNTGMHKELYQKASINTEVLLTHYEVIDHSTISNISYVSTKTLKTVFDVFIDECRSKSYVIFKDVERSMTLSGWRHANSIKIDDVSYSTGYYMRIPENDMLYNNDRYEDVVEQEQIDKDVELNTIIEELNQMTKVYGKHTYIPVADINDMLKVKPKYITKEDIETLLSNLSFKSKPVYVKIASKSLRVYEK